MGSKNSTPQGGDSGKTSAAVIATSAAEYNWGEVSGDVPKEEMDPNEMVLQSWANCKSKPNPIRHYRSDTEEKERRQALGWRKRTSFIELDCGEDSFFVSNTYKTIGIADGVGGWKEEGVKAEAFSNTLMENAKHYTETHRTVLDPEKIMKNAYDKLVADRKVKAGSSTACIATLRKHMDEDGKETNHHYLDVANLGDSGLMVVRSKEIIHRVHEKVHGVASPYQLSVLPKHLEGRAYADHVEDSIRETVDVQEGDVIVMGTDGLFDNRFATHLAQEAGWIGKVEESMLSKVPLIGWFLSTSLSEENLIHVDPHRISQRIVNEAYRHAVSKELDTPWSAMLRSYGVEDAHGGKVDDISLILARVAPREDLFNSPQW